MPIYTFAAGVYGLGKSGWELVQLSRHQTRETAERAASKYTRRLWARDNRQVLRGVYLQAMPRDAGGERLFAPLTRATVATESMSADRDLSRSAWWGVFGYEPVEMTCVARSIKEV